MTRGDWAERQDDLAHILDRAVYYATLAVIDTHRRNESTDFGTLNSILAAEIMVVEGAALSDAGRQAWDQISGEGRDQTLRWANERIAGYRASRLRSWFENYRAEDLVHSWAAQKGLPDEWTRTSSGSWPRCGSWLRGHPTTPSSRSWSSTRPVRWRRSGKCSTDDVVTGSAARIAPERLRGAAKGKNDVRGARLPLAGLRASHRGPETGIRRGLIGGGGRLTPPAL